MFLSIVMENWKSLKSMKFFAENVVATTRKTSQCIKLGNQTSMSNPYHKTVKDFHE